MGNHVGQEADLEQSLGGVGSGGFVAARTTQRRAREEAVISDTMLHNSGEAETGGAHTAADVTQYLIKGAFLLFAVFSAALVMLGMVTSPAGARLVRLRTEAFLLIRAQLAPLEMHARSWGGPRADPDHRVSIAVSDPIRVLTSDDAAPSGYKYAYQSEPVDPKLVNQLCAAVNEGAKAFDLDFQGGPLKLGLRTADITEATLCDWVTGGDGSVKFSFDHTEVGRNMHGSSATGQVLCTSAWIGQPTCEFSADAFIVNGTGSLPDGQPLRAEEEVCEPAKYPPAVSPAYVDEWPVEPKGSRPDLDAWLPGYNMAVIRHEGRLVAAFRRNWDLIVGDLDESYVPISAPTLFNSSDHPHNLSSYQDPRLFVHRGELYMLVHGKHMDRHHGWMYLARLERVPATADVTSSDPAGPAGGFRLVQPRRLLVPEVVPPGLIASPDMESMFSRPHTWEKNWVPFVHDDRIHFLHGLNPPLVLRIPADLPGSNAAVNLSEGIRTEFVTDDSAARVRWRYGDIRGGTTAVYDADLDGYVALFHSQVNFLFEDLALMRDPHATPTNPHKLARKYYYMGFYVFAPRPPFSIQLMSEHPVVGAGFYADNAATQPRHIIFPQGLMIEPQQNETEAHYIVSYGKDDSFSWAARFDRRKLLATLQPPLPESWEGPPC